MKIIIKSIGAALNAIALVSKAQAGKMAYQIFCTPRQGKINEKQKDFLQTASRWTGLELNGEKIQCYEWEGKGEKVILAHGWESNSARWKNLILSLQKADFHIIAMDAPAHGNSGSKVFQAVKYATFINCVAQHFQAKYLVGHSVGGYASIYFLSHFEHAIEKVAIMGAPSDLSLILQKYSSMMGYSRRVHEGLLEYLHREFGHSVDYFKAHDFATKLTILGLVISDKDDFICAFAEGEQIAANWNGATFLATEKLGHGYQSRKVYHAVRDFLAA
jgi:pimeloyl-ACP methyl ester carboxylesterase